MVGVFRIDKIFTGLLESYIDNYHFEIRHGEYVEFSTKENILASEKNVTVDLKVLGEKWQLNVLATGLFQEKQQSSFLIFIPWVGLLLSALLAIIFYLYKIADERAEKALSAEALVRQQNAQLSLEKEKSQAASKAKTVFLANMSHDIRTPLRPSEKKLCRIIDNSAQTLLSLLNSILDISKFESGKMELDFVEVNIKGLCERSIDVVKTQADSKGLELSFKVNSDCGYVFKCDSVRIQQAVLNLLSNAVKFTESGKVSLEASINSFDEGYADIQFIVEDSGIGIPEELQEKVFKQFEQADTSTTRCYGGTGLGLSITHKVVEMHGGQVSLQSKLGEGSTFTISLKLEKAYKEVEKPDEHETPDLSSYHILICEDNDVNSEVLLKFLAPTMCRVSLAFDGEEALRCMETVHYDLVLLDIHMPRLNGIEALRSLKERRPDFDVPVIAVSANVNQENKQLCLDAGMVAFVNKPIEVDVLYSCIIDFLNPCISSTP